MRNRAANVEQAVAAINAAMAGTNATLGVDGDVVFVSVPDAYPETYRFPPAYDRLLPFLMGMRYAHGLDPFDNDLGHAILDLEWSVVLGYLVVDDGRTLPVTKRILFNVGGERIRFYRVQHDPEERARLEAALLRAYPLDEEVY